MPYCPECGAEIDAEAQFCGNCGASLTQTTEGGGQDEPHGETGGGQGTASGESQAGGRQPQGEGRQPQGEGRQPQGQDRQPQGQDRQPQGQGRQPQGQGRQPQGQGRHPQGQGRQPQGQGRGPGGSQGGRQGTGQARRDSPHERNGVFEFAFGYPQRDGWTPAILSSVMILFSIFIVPIFIFLGYGFRVARAAALGRPSPPSYEDWGGLFYDGLRFTAVGLLGGLIWLLIAGLIVGGLYVGVSEIGALIVGILLYIASGWFIGAFQTAFIGSNSVPGAIIDGRALSLLRSGYYLKAWLLFFVLALIIGVISSLASFTIIGPIFVAGYAVLAYGAFWGYIYFRATQMEIVEPPVEDPQPTPQTGTPQQSPRR